jgi:starch synthase (maltosyl-transferring)
MAGRRPDLISLSEGRPGRVVVENLRPCVAGGRFPIKRVVGEPVEVEADAHADGHDVISVVLEYRRASDGDWQRRPMEPLGNDRWRAQFRIGALEPHRYRVAAWIDAFGTWRRDLVKRHAAAQVSRIDLLVGAALVRQAAERSAAQDGADADALASRAAELEAQAGTAAAVALALDETLLELVEGQPDRAEQVLSPELLVDVDREKARFSTWYELFPRSCSPVEGRHGRFEDVIGQLPRIARMGFDILYLPPIHPIGRIERKGRNNNPVAEPGDVGSPWAIGAAEGGHDAIHPELGTLEDFRRLIEEAAAHGIELAMDLAFQCAPDHPWVSAHPEWFRVRPDGSVQYAENPPKKYQDIYPLSFEGSGWRELWAELLRVVLHWSDQGIRIFRVDNPHTKPYRFWEWLIREVRQRYPETLFLAEAFTRPRVMHELARLGFSQSYTYFTWRNTRPELVEYLGELTQGEPAQFMRPNFWPNTPDILPEPLQVGGPPVFRLRLALAATLTASYGIYGPAFELCEGRPRSPGSEEYLDSEKYQLRHWDLESPQSLAPLITRLNRIRRENPALQRNDTLRFLKIDDSELIAFSKTSPDAGDAIVVVVNLDPHHVRSGWLELPMAELGLGEGRGYQMHDLLSDARYFWHGPRNWVQLDPASTPAHVFRVRRQVRTERDFDYFL